MNWGPTTERCRKVRKYLTLIKQQPKTKKKKPSPVYDFRSIEKYIEKDTLGYSHELPGLSGTPRKKGK